ncbi:MAG: ABC transporter ATP-binding protein [Mariprofundales bacterium]
MPALEVRGLCKTYPSSSRSKSKKALDGVDISVPEGVFFALLGPNGAGKTTLINILADVVHPSAGSMSLFGHNVFGNRDDRRWCKSRMGIVPQEVAFDPFFNVRDVLRISSGFYGVKADDDWLDDLLTQLGLLEHAHKNTRELSGGMRRRLLVAQALAHKPPFVVLDEPTAGVDVELRRGLWQFMRRLNAEGTTVLLTTHYLEEAEQLCEHVAIMHEGRVLRAETMQTLMAEVASAYVWLRFDRDIRAEKMALAKLTAFKPCIDGTGKVLHLRLGTQTDGNSFHNIYSVAVQAFGAPEDAGVKREALEDVFVRLTADARNADMQRKEQE